MRCLAGVLLVALVGGCSGAGKREAASLVDAVDRYRRADAASRESLGRGVSDVECTDARVCDARQACVAAIDPTVRALALKDEVARGIADLEQKRMAPDSPEAKALPAKLDEAERLLKDGRSKMATCDARLTDLRAAFGV